MRTLAGLLVEATAQLSAVTQTPRLDAEILLAHALRLSRAQLLARTQEPAEVGNFTQLLARRQSHEPIAYIIGRWEFFSLDFAVRAPMLVPRPETEHLVEFALENLPSDRPARVLDLGTGSGCVAIAIAHNAPSTSVCATDINPQAIALATENAHDLGVNVDFHQGDLFAALDHNAAPFDLIVSNPPYVEEAQWATLDPTIRLYEDAGALLGGTDGLDIIRRIVGMASQHLAADGYLALEIGEKQFAPLKRLLEEEGYAEIGFRLDLADIQRIVVAKYGSTR